MNRIWGAIAAAFTLVGANAVAQDDETREINEETGAATETSPDQPYGDEDFDATSGSITGTDADEGEDDARDTGRWGTDRDTRGYQDEPATGGSGAAGVGPESGGYEEQAPGSGETQAETESGEVEVDEE